MGLPEPPQPDQPPPPPGMPPPQGMPPPPPPPPVAPPPGAPAYRPTAGYALYGHLQRTRTLSKTARGLYWGVVVGNVAAVAAVFHRKSVLDDIISRGTVRPSDVDADDRAAALVGAALLLTLALQVAGGIVTAVWSYRIASNAKGRGATHVSPGMAAGGWFIPIGNLWLGFREVRLSLESTGGPGDTVKMWQRWFVVAIVWGVLSRGAAGGTHDSLESLRDSLAPVMVVTLISAGLLAMCALKATAAMAQVDDALSGG